MVSEIIDQDLELDPNWLAHLPADGSNIGGITPVAAGFVQAPPGSKGILLFVKGSPYATQEAYLKRQKFDLPILTFSYSLTVDGNTAKLGQVIETDIIATDAAGFKYDGSFQINIAEGWMLQIDTATTPTAPAKWLDTGIKIAPLTPDVPHAISIAYQFGPKTITVLSYTVDGVTSKIPVTLNCIPAVASTWAPGIVLVQLQQCVSALGGGYSIEFSDVKLRWSQA